MNAPETDLDDLIDRVVDGGLAPAELREAIARIEATPDGWRRCALAFLEVQALGQILREMDGGRSPVPVVVPIRRVPIASRRLAYAASLAMLAFGLGWLGHGAIGESTGKSRRADPTSLAGPTPLSDAKGDRRPTPPARQLDSLGAGLPAPPESSAVLGAGLPTPPEPTTEGLLAEEPNGIPLEDWLRDQPPPISSYAQAALEREGYRVEQRREVVIGTLDDGRLAAVPVDQVAVEYVGHLPL